MYLSLQRAEGTSIFYRGYLFLGLVAYIPGMISMFDTVLLGDFANIFSGVLFIHAYVVTEASSAEAVTDHVEKWGGAARYIGILRAYP